MQNLNIYNSLHVWLNMIFFKIEFAVNTFLDFFRFGLFLLFRAVGDDLVK